MLMRHGVRSPTESTPASSTHNDRPWPIWPVSPGRLTPRGAQGAALLGRQDRSYFNKTGVLSPQGCPSSGAVVASASSASRAIDTAKAWVDAAFPRCGIAVAHPHSDREDALFHPLSNPEADFDGHAAWLEAMRALPHGGMAGLKARHSAEIRLLATVLGCSLPNCDLAGEPATVLEKSHDRPHLTGVFEIGTTASQNLLLEYLEGMPMSEVGWGRADQRTIERLLAFHPIEFRYSNRLASVARTAGGPLATLMANTLSSTGANRKITLLAGHDTNIADVASLLALHWKIPGYPRDEVPPASALGFELWADAEGHRFVRAFFRSPTMRGLRNLDPAPPQRRYLDIPGCGRAGRTRSCTAEHFLELVRRAVDRP